MTRDVRYGLTHGLAFRGKADGILLLVEMATRDPVRQSAEPKAAHSTLDAESVGSQSPPGGAVAEGPAAH